MIPNPVRCLAVIALLLLVPGASAVAETELVEPGRMIVVKAATVTLPAGGSAEATVTITLLPKYEILASPPPSKWTTPASMAVVSSGGIVAKTPVFPEAKKTRDEDGGREINVLSGTFDVRIPIEASAKAAPGNKVLKGRLRYQAHIEGQYYKVAIRDFEIPVKVVKAKKDPAPAAPATRP